MHADKNETQEPTKAHRMPIRELVKRDARRVALFLTRQSEHLSARQKKTVLLVCGVMASVASMALILSPMLSKPSARKSFVKVDSIPSHSPRGKSADAFRALDSVYEHGLLRPMMMLQRRWNARDTISIQPRH